MISRYFRKVFGPIGENKTETFELSRSPDWGRLRPYFQSSLSPFGNLLPSKKIAKPAGEVLSRSARFTMNYRNMFMVMPSVKMEQTESCQIKVEYYYKAPWKWAQYYWFGFSTFFFVFCAVFMMTGLIVNILKFKAPLADIIIHQLLSLIIAAVGAAFLYFGLYFRRDLMRKAQILVSQYIEILDAP